PARSTVAATPMTLARWRLLRIALALPLLLGVWSASLWAMTTTPATPFTPDARGALTLQFAAMLAVALAAAAVAIRVRRDHQGGLSGVVALFSLLGLGYALPHPWTLIAAPADDAWHPAQQRWGVLLALALLTVSWASRNRTVRRHPDARIPS
ncbi:MAG: hypothetical protein LC777_14025, partial [Actinobacteria bacterium]|nr:hypothetical protein [Actinomycetota bacterium]